MHCTQILFSPRLQGPGTFRRTVAELTGRQSCPIFGFWPIFLTEPLKHTFHRLHRRTIQIFLCGSRRSKGVPSGTGDCLRLMVGELPPKLAQIFAYGKWLYPYIMLLYGASDLDQRCLKMRRSAVVAFLGVATKYLCPYFQIPPENPILGNLSMQKLL